MNTLDTVYQNLLETLINHGVEKHNRNGKTRSVFGYQIRHDMQEGFPLLTTKKMYWKGIVTELLWFLRGDTNIKYLVDNDCHIWDGDAFKAYVKYWEPNIEYIDGKAIMTQEEFINKIKTDTEFAKKWGELGPIYGAQWRDWSSQVPIKTTIKDFETGEDTYVIGTKYIDQIANLINDLKTNPDSRRLMVNAWNVGELDSMVLPPCHYSWQVYTRELSLEERNDLLNKKTNRNHKRENCFSDEEFERETLQDCKAFNIPTRAISLMWNQRSVDTFLGLPFNIASYGLLLEIIAKEVNMVPDQLIGSLGDVHLYENHIEQAKEQIGREMTTDERNEWHLINRCGGNKRDCKTDWKDFELDQQDVPKRTREPYPLPKLICKDEYWYLKDIDIPFSEKIEKFQPDFFRMENYESHPAIKAPLSN